MAYSRTRVNAVLVCDRQKPECSQCLSAKIKCEPRLVGHVSAEEDNPHEGSANSLNTIDYIRRRIGYLEEQLNYQQLPSPSETQPNDLSSNGNARSRTGDALSHGPTFSAEDRIMDHAVNEIGYLSLAAMGGPSDHNQDLECHTSSAHFAVAAMNLPGGNPSLSASIPLKPTQSGVDQWLDEHHLNDFTLAKGDFSSYVRKYFQYSNSLHPVVSEAECIEAFNTIKEAEENGTFAQVASVSPEKVAFAYLPVALGVVTESGLTATVIIPKIMKKVKDVLPRLMQTASHLQQIQVFMMAAFMTHYSPVCGSCWYLVGLAVSKAVSLGMHRQTSRLENSANVQFRERIFWTIYKLDRPFTIEDSDIILDLPEMPLASSVDPRAELEALNLWAIYHTQMLSDWRNEPDAHPQFYMSSYDYWRDTYQGLTIKALQIGDEEPGNHDPAFHRVLRKYEIVLRLRSVVQLATICSRHERDDYIRTRIEDLVYEEVPEFVFYVQSLVEDHVMAPSFLDGYDAFAAGTVYIHTVFRTPLRNNQPHTNTNEAASMYTVGARNFMPAQGSKTIAYCAEIISFIGERFPSMKAMKEVLWSFLAAAEARQFVIGETDLTVEESAGTDQALDNAISKLRKSIKDCEIEIPSHLRDLMATGLSVRCESITL